MDMKGLILAGGMGSRLRPFTYTGPKQLVPVANKPVLFYGIEDMVRFGIRQVGIIVGHNRAKIEEVVGTGDKWGIEISYIDQKSPLGLAHAVKISRNFLGQSKTLMILGDNFVEEDLTPVIHRFANDPALNGMLILAKVPNPQDFGVVETDGDRVIAHVEKPQYPKSDYIGTGYYLFDHHAYEGFEGHIKPSVRGELEITSIYQYYLQKGYNVGYYKLKGSWVDTGKLTDVLEANRIVLSKLEGQNIEGDVDSQSQITGPVQLGPGSKVIRSHIRGPVIIGNNCTIQDAFVGPFSSISDGVTLTKSELEYCVIMEGSTISDIPYRLDSAMIGRYVTVTQIEGRPKAAYLELGDHSVLRLPSNGN